MTSDDKFIEHLFSYTDVQKPRRAELAVLRRGASGESRDLARVYPLVLPWAGHLNQDACIETACLFGLHPTKPSDKGRSVSLAEAMRRLSEKSGSIEARFIALLQCHEDELPIHLRHCVGLAKSNDIPLHWRDVLNALQHWSREPRPGFLTVQQRWARDFWSPRAPKDTADEQRPDLLSSGKDERT